MLLTNDNDALVRCFVILYIQTFFCQPNGTIKYIMPHHVGIGCSFGTPDHNCHGLLAENLNANFINLSEAGQGNFRIYTELLYWIETNQDKLHQTTFSIGWSGIYRNDMIENSNNDTLAFKWTRWNADLEDPTTLNLPKKMDVTLDHTVRFLVNVISTQKLLASAGCKYVMFNGIDTYMDRSNFDTHSALKVKILEKIIDKKRFFRFSDSHSKFVAENGLFLDPTPSSLIQKIINWPTDDSQYAVKDAHPSPEGNRRWANLVWEFCQADQLL